MKSTEGEIFAEIVQGHRATIVELGIYFNKRAITATGEAVRHPDDKVDNLLAIELATGRALEALSRKVLKRANGKIKSNDDNRRHSESASAKVPTEDPELGTDLGHTNYYCFGITKAGKPCSFTAKPGSNYCGHHGEA